MEQSKPNFLLWSYTSKLDDLMAGIGVRKNRTRRHRIEECHTEARKERRKNACGEEDRSGMNSNSKPERVTVTDSSLSGEAAFDLAGRKAAMIRNGFMKTKLKTTYCEFK